MPSIFSAIMDLSIASLHPPGLQSWWRTLLALTRLRDCRSLPSSMNRGSLPWGWQGRKERKKDAQCPMALNPKLEVFYRSSVPSCVTSMFWHVPLTLLSDRTCSSCGSVRAPTSCWRTAAIHCMGKGVVRSIESFTRTSIHPIVRGRHSRCLLLAFLPLLRIAFTYRIIHQLLHQQQQVVGV